MKTRRGAARFRSLTIALPVAASFVFGTSVLVSPGHALASTKPPTDLSYYVSSADTDSTAQTLGCNQAQFDNTNHANSYVTLDFGAQRYDGAGTYLPSTTYFWSNSQDVSYALYFAYGYESCTPSYTVNLNIGTNNSGSGIDGALGADWGSLVQEVANDAAADGYSNVYVEGATDAEPGYSTFAVFTDWELGDSTGGGYQSTTSLLISDFGSADGCPGTLGDYGDHYCDNTWYQSSVYDAAWGYSPNAGNPEIYYNGCNGLANQPVQWANISDFGIHYGKSGQILFEGPLDQDNCLTSAEAWSDFQTALSDDGVSSAMSYSTEITTK